MIITIIGAGNIGTHFAIMFADVGCEVKILTPRYKEISKNLELVDADGILIKSASILFASDDAKSCIENADIIFITTPAHIANELCEKILPFIKQNQILCFVPGSGGVEFAFKACLQKGAKIYELQRVPSIARLTNYGKKIWASKPRNELFVSSLGGDKNGEFLNILSIVFNCKVTFLKDFLNISLATSNPIFHTARLYTIFKNYKNGCFYGKLPLFHEEWNDESSILLLKLDDELKKIIDALKCFDLSGIKSIKEHYEINNEKELTSKIRSIPAFKGLKTPGILLENKGYKPDWNSRYFVTDFSFGLTILVQIANFFSISVPYMKKTLNWYNEIIKPTNSFNFTNYGIFNKNDFVSFYT